MLSMNTLQINITGLKPQTIIYPAGWNELNAAQLISISAILNQNLLTSDFRVKTVTAFLGKKNLLFAQYAILLRALKKTLSPDKQYAITQKINYLDECIYGISESLNWIHAGINITKQCIPSVFKLRKLYGPATFLADVRFIEYAKAETFYNSFINTKDEVYLDKLIATLYRPQVFAWQVRRLFTYGIERRVKFTDDCTARNVVRIALLKPEIKMAILTWFVGCRNAIVAKYPNVFNQSDDTNGDGFGWAGLITHVSGGKFGDQDKTAYTNLHDILRMLEQERVQFEEYKAKHPEQFNS